MTNDEMVVAQSEFETRVTDELSATAPGFDPAIIPTMIELLMDLLSSCGNKAESLKPEDAINRVKELSTFEQAMLKSRLKRRAKQNGIQDADNLVPKAIRAVRSVAADATPDEQVAFAKTVLNISSPDYEML